MGKVQKLLAPRGTPSRRRRSGHPAAFRSLRSLLDAGASPAAEPPLVALPFPRPNCELFVNSIVLSKYGVDKSSILCYYVIASTVCDSSHHLSNRAKSMRTHWQPVRPYCSQKGPLCQGGFFLRPSAGLIAGAMRPAPCVRLRRRLRLRREGAQPSAAFGGSPAPGIPPPMVLLGGTLRSGTTARRQGPRRVWEGCRLFPLPSPFPPGKGEAHLWCVDSARVLFPATLLGAALQLSFRQRLAHHV